MSLWLRLMDRFVPVFEGDVSGLDLLDGVGDSGGASPRLVGALSTGTVDTSAAAG